MQLILNFLSDFIITCIYLFYLFIQYLMRLAQLAINNYSTLWPSKHITQYIHLYNIAKEQLNTAKMRK